MNPTRTRDDEALTPFGGAFRSLFDRVFDLPAPSGEQLPAPFNGRLAAPLNVAETEKDLVLTLEIPGLDEDDIDVQVIGNQLTISGEKSFKKEVGGKDAQYHRVESRYGSFSRTMTLPDTVKADAVEADYSKGVLTVTVPKVSPRPATKVKVKARS